MTWTTPPPHTEPPEVLIAWAITCLRSNNMRGWYEIAGTGGSFVECHRDGQVATRVAGAVQYHGTVEDAGLRIVNA